MPQFRRSVCVWILCLFLFVTTTARAVTRTVKTVVGIASYYGHVHQGRRMANGQRFDESKLTAASRTLPLGTRVKVTSLRNQKSVIVTITDRGPAAKTRVIDLSTAAARALGMISRGVDKVRVDTLH